MLATSPRSPVLNARALASLPSLPCVPLKSQSQMMPERHSTAPAAERVIQAYPLPAPRSASGAPLPVTLRCCRSAAGHHRRAARLGATSVHGRAATGRLRPDHDHPQMRADTLVLARHSIASEDRCHGRISGRPRPALPALFVG